MAIKGDLAHWEAEDFGTELIELTLGDLLDRRAEELPDKEALVYSYPELGLTYNRPARTVDQRDGIG